MTRVLSYNILVGGTHRVDQLVQLIQSGQPDVVGLVEAVDEEVVKELSKRMNMGYILSGRSKDDEGWQAAILSRLPLIEYKIYSNGILTKQPLLEVSVEDPCGQPLTIFVTHLTAAFSTGKAAYHARYREIQEILRIMAFKQGTKHLLMGDFNSLAPGERLKGSSFLRYVIDPHLYYQLKPDTSIRPPDLDFILPPLLHFLKPVLEFIPKSKFLSYLLDSLDFLYAPRGGIDLLTHAHYIDCFRLMKPDEKGFTWPAPMPSGRVDFIFASVELTQCLSACNVIKEGNGIAGDKVSDHLPIFADFDESPHEQ